MKEFHITDDGIQLHAKLDMPEEKEKWVSPSGSPAESRVPVRQRAMEMTCFLSGSLLKIKDSAALPIQMDWKRKTTAREADRLSREW